MPNSQLFRAILLDKIITHEWKKRRCWTLCIPTSIGANPRLDTQKIRLGLDFVISILEEVVQSRDNR